MNTQILHVRDPWLDYIQNGIKVVEGRKGNIAKYINWIGKKITFYNEVRKVEVEVLKLEHYDDLYSYLEKEGYNKVLPNIESYDTAVDEYHKFYSDEDIKIAGGMVAIYIKV